MRHADYIVDMGPGAGVHGGHIVAEGTPQEIMDNPRSLTGKYLSGELKIEIPTERRKPVELYLPLKVQKKTTSNASVCSCRLVFYAESRAFQVQARVH